MVDPVYWKPAAQIVQYEMWGLGIGSARPVTVVVDGANYIALYSPPRTTFISRGVEGHKSLDLPDRIELDIRMLDPDEGEFRKKISPDIHVLTLTPPESWHSITLFWSAEWQFKSWYVNFQSPIRRVSRGIQFHDYALDLVVRPDLSWSWKDVDEFEALAARGFFTAKQESSIRSEAKRVVRTIEAGGPPFSDGWENWRPDQRWPIPHLYSDWLVEDSPNPSHP